MSSTQGDQIKKSRIRRIVNQHRGKYRDGIPVSVIKVKSEAVGIDADYVETFIEREVELGRLYRPKDGHVSVT